MAVYRTITLTIMQDGGNQTHQLGEADKLEKVEGGIEITWASSPMITTFYPYHRVAEMQVVDTNKGKK